MALRHAAARLGGLQRTAAVRVRVRDVFFPHSKARLSSTLEKDARLRTIEKDYIAQIEKTKAVLYNLMAVANRHRLIGGLQRRYNYAELLQLLSVHIEPRPHDPHWRRVARIQSIRDYVNIAALGCVGLTVANAWDWYVKASKEEEHWKQFLRPSEYEDLL